MILKADVQLSGNYHHNMTDMGDNDVIHKKQQYLKYCEEPQMLNLVYLIELHRTSI